MKRYRGILVYLTLALALSACCDAGTWIKQSTAYTARVQMVDFEDGVTPTTGLVAGTMDEVSIYKGAATAATDISGTTTLTHRAGGVYTVTLTTTDTNTLGCLMIVLRDDSVCLPTTLYYTVIPANSYDSIIAGSDYLDANAVQIEGADATNQINAEADQALTDYGANTTVPDAAGVAPTAVEIREEMDSNSADLNTIAIDVAGLDGDAMVGTDGAALAATALSASVWTAARAAALTDLIDGGRLDLIFDTIAIDVAGLDGDAMVGTDGAALAATALSTSVWTAARAAALTDLIDGGRLDLLFDLTLGDTSELQSNQGAWMTATGFSTHAAADVWTATTRALTATGLDAIILQIDGSGVTLPNCVRLAARHLDGDWTVSGISLTHTDADGIIASWTMDSATAPTKRTKD